MRNFFPPVQTSYENENYFRKTCRQYLIWSFMKIVFKTRFIELITVVSQLGRSSRSIQYLYGRIAHTFKSPPMYKYAHSSSSTSSFFCWSIVAYCSRSHCECVRLHATFALKWGNDNSNAPSKHTGQIRTHDGMYVRARSVHCNA